MKGGSSIGRTRTIVQVDVQREAAGFTIVETLIVLAVTGLILFTALLGLQGKVSHTEFTQAINDIQAQIQQTINDTANGYYPPPATHFTCDTTGPGGAPKITATGSEEQGAHAQCTFIGKVIQFGVHGTNPEDYVIYPLVGRRCDLTLDCPSTPQTVAAALPIALYPSLAVAPGVDGSVTNHLQNGLKVRPIQYTGTSSGTTGAIGFIADPETLAKSVNGTNQAAGAQATNLYAIKNTNTGFDQPTMVQSINTPSNLVRVTTDAKICFYSNGTNQSGLLTIGGAQSGQNAITLKIFSGLNCT